ncbi:Crp/Fnr family transcriptional regulator [Actinomadura fibrosa]|uniref:Crp/Fnr family transcriptional regulator n=1 Tax=Actinomadura fibrosa TaxID=111802 RepID=A0ABW2XHE2_9ACTN|nr:Crp/Fnr family transcriptional regulator [Actinomadura fibrosa]
MPRADGTESGRPWPSGTFLSRLPRESRTRLLRLGQLRSFPAQHTLVRQGDPGGSVWLLLDALVKVSARVENGSQALLALRVGGDLVGEMAVLDGAPRSATVTGCGRMTVSQIRGAAFVRFLQEHPPAAMALSQMAVERLRWSNQRRLDFAGYETSRCLARVLLALAERHGRPVARGLDLGVPITQAELGGLIGAKENTVHRALRELTDLGLVGTPGRRRVIIEDPARLAAYADLTPAAAPTLSRHLS